VDITLKKIFDEKKQSVRSLTGILFTVLHYAFAVLLSYAGAWISYRGVKKVGGTTLILFPLVLPQDILMVNILFYLLGLAVDVMGYMLLFALHRKLIECVKPLKSTAYKDVNIIMLVLSCILSIGAAVLAYLNTIFPQGSLKYELFFSGICTNIIPVMMVILYIRDKPQRRY